MIEMMTSRKPLPSCSIKKIVLLVLGAFFLCLASCFDDQAPSDEAGALRELVRKTIHSFESPLLEALKGHNEEDVQDLLGKIRTEFSAGRDPANYAVGLLDKDGVVVASVSSGPASPGIFFSRYESFREVMKKKKIVSVRFYLQSGHKLMTIVAPVQNGASLQGILAVTILDAEMKNRWGITEEVFLSLNFNR